MASLHKRIGSPFWWGKFRDETGSVRFRSTKTAARGDALQILLGWEHAVVAAKRGEFTRPVLLKTMKDILDRTTGELLESSKGGRSLRQLAEEQG